MHLAEYFDEEAVRCIVKGDIVIEGIKDIGFHIDNILLVDVSLTLGNHAPDFGSIDLVGFASQ
jgi:hypothetical protein